MITFFRNLSETWIAKLLMALVAISMMSVFGISGMTGFWGQDNIAIKVGSESVTTRKLLLDFDTELRRMNSLTGGYMTAQEAISRGLLMQVIEKDTVSLMRQVLAEKMGMIASDESVRNYIINNPNFQTMTGGFDRAMFIAYLRQTGMNEVTLSNALREELSQKHIFDAVADLAYVPSKMAGFIFTYENESRDLTMLLVDQQNVPVTAKPTDDDLRTYYAAMQDELYSPEYRSVSYMYITPEGVTEGMQITLSQIRDAFEAKKEALSVPEKRDAKQMLFSEESDAINAKKGLTAANFDKVAKEKAGQDEAATNLGLISKNDVLAEMGDALFEAKKGIIVGPVQTSVGWHLFLVTDIIPAKEVTLSDVRADIIAEIKAQKAYDIMYAKTKEMDEMIGAGESLENAAAKVELKIEKIDAVDAAGMTKNGEKVLFADNQEAMQALMKFKKGAVTPLIEQGTGFLLLRTDEITPMALKSLDDVRGELIEKWKKDQQAAMLAKFAEDTYEEIKNGTPMNRVARKYDLEEKDLKDLSRKTLAETFATSSVSLFELKEGQATLIQVGPVSYVVVRINRIKDADPTEDDVVFRLALNEYNNRTASIYSDIFLSSFAKQVGVKLHEEAIQKTFAAYLKPVQE